MSDEVKKPNPPQPGLDAAMKETANPPAMFSTQSATEIVNQKLEAPPEIWGGMTYTSGSIMEVIGPAGLGKSRLMLNLAINQIIGYTFAGLKTYEKPLTWLFYGNENSLYRFHSDLTKMFKSVNADQRQKIGEHLFLPTSDTPADFYITLADEGNREKLYQTIVHRNANVVVMDPWGSIIDGDELKDGDVRRTITELTGILSKAGNYLGHPVTAIIINHSRNGLREIIGAVGSEAANYGKNSKAIYSMVRTVWNLRQGEISPHVNKIEFIHAKHNDSKGYDPVCVKLNPKYMTYDVDPTFNHDVHQRMLEQAQRSHQTMTESEKKNADATLKDGLLTYITNKGSECSRILQSHARESGISKNKFYTFMSELVDEKKIVKLVNRQTKVVYYCTEAGAIDLMKKSKLGEY